MGLGILTSLQIEPIGPVQIVRLLQSIVRPDLLLQKHSFLGTRIATPFFFILIGFVRAMTRGSTRPTLQQDLNPLA